MSKLLVTCAAISRCVGAHRKQEHPLGLSPLLAHGQAYLPGELRMQPKGVQ